MKGGVWPRVKLWGLSRRSSGPLRQYCFSKRKPDVTVGLVRSGFFPELGVHVNTRGLVHWIVLAANPPHPWHNACSDTEGTGLATNLEHPEVFTAAAGEGEGQCKIIDQVKLSMRVGLWKFCLVPESPQERAALQDEDVFWPDKRAGIDLLPGRLGGESFRNFWKAFPQSPLPWVVGTRRKHLWQGDVYVLMERSISWLPLAGV